MNALERVNMGNLIKMIIVELDVDKVNVKNCRGRGWILNIQKKNSAFRLPFNVFKFSFLFKEIKTIHCHPWCDLCKRDELQLQSVEPYLKEITWPHIKRLAKDYTFICFKLK